jgi:hypothetical protein
MMKIIVSIFRMRSARIERAKFRRAIFRATNVCETTRFQSAEPAITLRNNL